MSAAKRIAVVLFQLGGPDSQAAVEPFLYNLFCDPDIINFPRCIPRAQDAGQADFDDARESRAAALRGNWRRLADSASHRAASSRAGNSATAPHPGTDHGGHALLASDTAEAIAALGREPFDELVLLPLYPHYSFATTRQQSEGMEAPVQIESAGAAHRSFLRSSRLHRRHRRAHQQVLRDAR